MAGWFAHSGSTRDAWKTANDHSTLPASGRRSRSSELSLYFRRSQLRAGIGDAVLRQVDPTDVTSAADCGHSGERIGDGSGNGVEVRDDTI